MSPLAVAKVAGRARLVSLGFSALVGIVFGFFPAWRATA
jgi:ABC-type antimicrobial peptide transport system permease subunit